MLGRQAAEQEIASIEQLYPNCGILRGRSATSEAFLGHARNADMIDFAGYTLASYRNPLSSILLMAPGGANDTGVLYVERIVKEGPLRARVVVLG